MQNEIKTKFCELHSVLSSLEILFVYSAKSELEKKISCATSSVVMTELKDKLLDLVLK